jgi:hypothetical protein
MDDKYQNAILKNGDLLKKIENLEVSLYPRITNKTNNPIRIKDILRIIKTGEGIKAKIQALRAETDETKRVAIKKELPAITPSALFDGARKIENLRAYSGILALDFDKVENLTEKKKELTKDPYCFIVSLSPSGKGLKVLVNVETNKTKHLESFRVISSYFQNKYNLTADPSCKDITRLMFLTYDENAFVNENAKEYDSRIALEYQFDLVLTGLNQRDHFENGNRNNFIYKLASECCRKGIPTEDAVFIMKKRFHEPDFHDNEIISTTRSAYASNGNRTKIEPNSNYKSLSTLSKIELYINEKYDIRFNIVSTKIESRKKGSNEYYKELNENSLSKELQHANLNISFAKLSSLMLSDFVQNYNPFEDYFEGLNLWDAIEEPNYISKLCSYIPVEDEKRFRNHFEKMLVRCVACALDERVFNKQVFVLVHDTQNSGKSSFCRWLCPPSLSAYYTENINTDKDSVIALATNFLVNMDELATLSRQEINSLKSMISKDKINLRLPFAKKATVMPRRASFIGSTNKDEFLTDETGSVRWLCFTLKGIINFAYKENINITDIWRQAYTLYKANYKYDLTPAEIEENEKANETYQLRSMEMELIPKYYAISSKAKGGIFFTASEIMCKLNEMHPMVKLNIHSIGKAMKILGFKKESQYWEEKKYSQKGYYTTKIVAD